MSERGRIRGRERESKSERETVREKERERKRETERERLSELTVTTAIHPTSAPPFSTDSPSIRARVRGAETHTSSRDTLSHRK